MRTRLGGGTKVVQKVTSFGVITRPARHSGRTPLTPRGELTRHKTRWTIAVLLILSNLADATTISRLDNGTPSASLEIKTAMLHPIDKTTDKGQPVRPRTKDTVDWAWLGVARQGFRKQILVNALTLFIFRNKKDTSAGLLIVATRALASSRTRTPRRPKTQNAVDGARRLGANIVLDKMRTTTTVVQWCSYNSSGLLHITNAT
jgi:hypothetical protein